MLEILVGKHFIGKAGEDRETHIVDKLYEVAKRSNCTKRHVGCVMVNTCLDIITTGFNYVPRGENEFIVDPPSQDILTSSKVVHAEQDAISNVYTNSSSIRYVYVTRHPCDKCLKLLEKLGDIKIIVVEFEELTNPKAKGVNFGKDVTIWVTGTNDLKKSTKEFIRENANLFTSTDSGLITKAEEFKKFDNGKTKYHLLTKSMREAPVKVLEFGANKYGERNYLLATDRTKYLDALERHMLAYTEDPKSIDEESGLYHLWHLACNALILIDCEENGNLGDLKDAT